MDRFQSEALDRHITGNYGEDQFKNMDTDDTDDTFTIEELNSLEFFVSERKWRAMLAIRSNSLPVPEAMAYRSELHTCDTLAYKISQLKKKLANA